MRSLIDIGAPYNHVKSTICNAVIRRIKTNAYALHENGEQAEQLLRQLMKR